MEEKLLTLCGYSHDKTALRMVAEIKKNYSDFEGIVKAIETLKPILDHSDFYLSLVSERQMIKIKNDMVSDRDFLIADSDIIEWANLHHIELEEGLDAICILGFQHQETFI